MTRRLPGLGIALVFALACLVPFLANGQAYLLQIATLALCTAVPAMGLNLLFGYTGLVSLGQMGFAGAGGYAAALLMKAGWGFVPGLAAAAIAAGLVGLLVGGPCLRLRSHFFIIVTLAVGLVLFSLFNNLDAITGGPAGLPGIPRPRPLDLGFTIVDFRRPAGFYWLALAVFAGVFLVQAAIVRSDFGRALAAIRQDEQLAAARGINVFAHKLVIFAISAAIAGLGGALKVVLLRVASPQLFDLTESIDLVLVVLLGGPGFLLGPLLGAVVFTGLPELLRAANAMRLVVFGLILVLLALYAPKGLSGLAARLMRGREVRLPAILEIAGLHRAFGGVRAVDGVDLSLSEPGIVGLIGPNGAGKTTLFDLIAGQQPADRGEIRYKGRRIETMAVHDRARLGFARTFQECRVLPEETCLDNLLFAAGNPRLGGALARVLTRRRSAGRAALDEATRLLALVKLAAFADRPAADLSYGQRRLLEIASALMARPGILLLDEPAAGVNPTLLNTVHDLLRHVVAERRMLMIVVEHNMPFIMSLAGHIVVMQSGRVLAEGAPEAMQRDARVVEAYLG